jgi:hypothetical protein
VALGTGGVVALCPVEFLHTVAGAVMAGVPGQPTTLTLTLPELFAVLVSGVIVLTTAVLVMVVPEAGAVTLMTITGAVVVAASGPIVQVTVDVPEQLQPVPAALPKVTPGGSVSVTVTSCVGPLPVLVTVIV